MPGSGGGRSSPDRGSRPASKFETLCGLVVAVILQLNGSAPPMWDLSLLPAAAHRADVVLVEDKASGISLIAELRSQHFSIVQEAPSIDGDKVMRLRGETAKIAGGFVLFPKEAHWLDAYVLELVTFPNSKE